MDNINLKIKINIDDELLKIKKKIESLKLKPLKIDLELNNVKNKKSKKNSSSTGQLEVFFAQEAPGRKQNYEELSREAENYVQSEKEVIKVQNDSKASALSLSSVGNALISSFTSSITDLVASFAINMLIKGLDSLIVTLEEQKQKVREAQEAYSNIKSEIQNINSELKITDDRINELQLKGNLTLTEKDELTRLQQTNYELERRKELLKKDESDKAATVNKENEKLYKKQIERATELLYFDEQNYFDFDTMSNLLKIAPEEQYKFYTNRLFELKSKNSLTDDEISEVENLERSLYDFSKKFIDIKDNIVIVDEKSQQLYDSVEDIIDSTYKALNPDSWNTNQINKLLSSDFSNIKEELLGLSNAGKLDEATLSKYSDFKSKLDNLGISADKAVSSINEITNTQFKISPDQGIKESIDEVQTFSDKIKTLQAVYNALNNNEKISTDTISQLIMKYPEYSSELLKINENREAGISLVNQLFEIEKKEAIESLEQIKAKILSENELLKLKQRIADTSKSTWISQEALAAYKKIKESENATKDATKIIEGLQASLNGLNTTDNATSNIYKVNEAKNKDDTLKNKFQEEYNSLKEQRSNDIINAQQYYDKLKKLNNDYFANKPEYADEYQQYELELHRLSQDLAEEKIKNWEFNIQLKINAVGEEETVDEQIKVYTQIQDELHRLAEEERSRKVGKNEELIQKYSQQWWEYEQKKFNITKQYYDKQKSLYEGYISTIEKIQDMTISMIKKEMEMNKELHAEKIKSINDEFDLKRSLLDGELDEYTYSKELQSKIDNVNKIQSQIDLIKNDESNKGKLKQLEDELKQATTELDDFQYNHDIDLQKQILDEQEKLLVDEQQAKIDAIDEKLNNEVYLKQQADEKIKSSGQNLYNELIAFSEKYGTISKHEIDEIWIKYSAIIDKFDIKQNGVTATLGTLYNQLLDVKTVLEDINNMSLGDFNASKYSKPRTKEDVIADMKANSKAWHETTDVNIRDDLVVANIDLAEELEKILKEMGIISKEDSLLRSSNGELRSKLTGVRYYHNGGIVDKNITENKLKPNELHSILEEGELVISKNGVKNLLENIIPIKNVSTLGLPNYFYTPLPNLLSSINHTSSTGDIVIENNYNITGTTSEELLNNMKQMVDINSNYTIKKIAELAKNNSGNKINTIYKY